MVYAVDTADNAFGLGCITRRRLGYRCTAATGHGGEGFGFELEVGLDLIAAVVAILVCRYVDLYQYSRNTILDAVLLLDMERIKCFESEGI